MTRKKILTLLLILSFLAPAFYNPYSAPRAQALFGVGDINLESIPVILELVLKKVGTLMAQRMIDDMVKQTVTWAQNGFDGNPAYATNPEQFFTNIADGVAGEFIKGSDLGYLCSPFQAQIRLSLANQYVDDSQPFQCTLTGINGNIEDFYKDFSKGGWSSWFSMTQNSNNNPYGAYLNAKIELDSRIAEKVGLEKDQLDWNQGFLSWKGECPEEYVVTREQAEEWRDNPDITNKEGFPYEAGQCLNDNLRKVATPGSTIKSQLDQVLPSGLNKLIKAESLDQLLTAFASGLLQRYVFGDKGIFAGGSSSASSEREIVDIDADRIPDGWDYDADGELDICHHGLVNPVESPSNTNCLGSKGVGSSPFFIPMCEDVSGAIGALEKLDKFVDTNTFSSTYSRTWSNRLLNPSGTVEKLADTLSRYEAPQFNPAIGMLGVYSKQLDKRIESLAKDDDLHTLGEGAGNAQRKLSNHTKSALNFLYQFQEGIGNRCDNPDIAALGAIVPPDLESEGGGMCEATGFSYQGDLLDAMDRVLAENPDVAALPNIESGGRQNARTFLALVEAELISMGLQATDEVLNGNGNPSTGDIIAVWREGDETMERYDAIIGAAETIGEAGQAEFTGFISLNCTTSGGERDCACESGDGGGDDDGEEFGNEPESVLSDIQAERSKYGTPMTEVEVGKLLNAVAWKNRDAGWRLLGKEGGSNCPAPGGQRISCDYLVHQGTYYGYDVLIDEEGSGTPSWQGPEDLRTSITSGSRTFVAPVAP